MPGVQRVSMGGLVYHVMNRANSRMTLFESVGDYRAFLKVLRETHEHIPMRTVSFCVMPNHWHLVLWPFKDGDLSVFIHWLSVTHSKRWHGAHGTTGTGHVYQGRFKSFPVQGDRHYLTVCRYVERNALGAGLCAKAEEWRWGSLWQRTQRPSPEDVPLSDGPRRWPSGWCEMLNSSARSDDVDTLRKCIARGRPFGTSSWVTETADRLGIMSTLRDPGRPRTR